MEQSTYDFFTTFDRLHYYIGSNIKLLNGNEKFIPTSVKLISDNIIPYRTDGSTILNFQITYTFDLYITKAQNKLPEVEIKEIEVIKGT